jgi:adenylate kinase
VRLIILGPQGAGKGTQATVVAGKFGIPHISTGDIFRANIADQTPLGVEAKAYTDSGELVPDEITNAMVKDRLEQPDASAGFLLDGYPRTAAQSTVLDDFLMSRGERLDAVIELNVDESQLLARLAKRAAEQGRTDDTDEAIRRRLDIYRQSTAPLVDYYRGQGVLRSVDGTGLVEEVTERILAALSA